jgi:eukaryotic-like serine/threonine-protein kinase
MPTQQAAITELLEQLADQFTDQLRRGEAPSIDDYANRHPQLAERIRALFPILELMESEASSSGQTPESEIVPSPQFERLGDFRILREIGRGGMGIVYQAVQESLGRTVALKLLPQVALGSRMNHRFQQEARLVAMLHHTNIVPIYGIGEEGGYSYFVMQFIEGTGLDCVLAELRSLRHNSSSAPNADHSASLIASGLHAQSLPVHPLAAASAGRGKPLSPVDQVNNDTAKMQRSTTQVGLTNPSSTGNLSATRHNYWQNVARIGVQVADGLAHAHAMGILHRDIKPGNLLLDEAGSVWITDFGLARLSDGSQLTRTGEVVGTLRYLPPEQLSGQSDLRGDIYGVGLTLYELATLQPAFPESDPRKLMTQVAESRPIAPRKIDSQIPRDLETIILKSMAAEPGKRYSTADDLAADLRRFLEGQPIRARRVSSWERMMKWSRRHPAVAALSTAVAVLTVVGMAGIAWQWRAATASLTIAQAEAQKRERINNFLINDFLSFADPEKEIDSDIRLRTVLDRAAASVDDRFADLPLEAADLHLQFGKIYLNLSQPESAKQHFTQSHQLRLTNLGAEHSETNEAWHTIGIAEAYLGRREEALAIFDQTIRTSAKQFGAESAETMRHRFNRAEVLHAMGRFAEAISEIDHYLSIAPEQEQLDANGALKLKANILADSGEQNQAQTILSELKRSFEQLVKIDGGQIDVSSNQMEDVYFLISVNEGLGLIASNQGYYDVALEIHRENFLLVDQLLGSSHSKTLVHAHNLAGTLLWSGDPQHVVEARELLENSTLLSEQHLGVAHPQTLSLQGVLAMALVIMGENESAESLLQEARRKAIGILGLDDPATLTLSQNLAATWSRSGQPEKAELAEQILLETIPLMREKLGDDHTQSINALSDLGFLQRRLGKLQQAEESLTTALELSRQTMRENHPELLTNITYLLQLLVETRQFDKAERLGAELVAGNSLEHGADHESTISSQNIQAFVYQQQQKFEQAYPLYHDVWESYRQRREINSPRAVTLLLTLTQVEHELGLHETSIPRLQEVLDTVTDSSNDGDDNPSHDWSILRLQYMLGRAQMECDAWADAEATLLATFEGMERFTGNVSTAVRQSSMRSTASCLAELYDRRGEVENHQSWQNKLNEIN